MAVSRDRVNSLPGVFDNIRIILEMIKFEHSIFALPFAMISIILAAENLPHGLPPFRIAFWVVICMISARSAAMAFNRIVDASYDACNPRTSKRAIPAGILTASQVAFFTLGALAIFEVACWKINPLCFNLSPLAILFILGYSYTKRFTYLSHIVLGLAIGISPVGAWMAVTDHISIPSLLLGLVVMLWIGGFDILYSLQDVEFDRKSGLYSLPTRLGKSSALLLSRFMHFIMILILMVIGHMCGLHAFYFTGVLLVAGLIWYEQSLVSPDDISRINLAFFTLNGWISISLMAFVILDRLWKH
jgi:4-hydroxybenzoate polyprenyltransferase